MSGTRLDITSDEKEFLIEWLLTEADRLIATAGAHMERARALQDTACNVRTRKCKGEE